MSVEHAIWLFGSLAVIGIVGLITYVLLDAAKFAADEEDDEDSWGI